MVKVVGRQEGQANVKWCKVLNSNRVVYGLYGLLFSCRKGGFQKTENRELQTGVQGEARLCEVVRAAAEGMDSFQCHCVVFSWKGMAILIFWKSRQSRNFCSRRLIQLECLFRRIVNRWRF